MINMREKIGFVRMLTSNTVVDVYEKENELLSYLHSLSAATKTAISQRAFFRAFCCYKLAFAYSTCIECSTLHQHFITN